MKFILHDKLHGRIVALREVTGIDDAAALFTAIYGTKAPRDLKAIPAPAGVASLADLADKKIDVATGAIVSV
jgi:hypothetical protein